MRGKYPGPNFIQCHNGQTKLKTDKNNVIHLNYINAHTFIFLYNVIQNLHLCKFQKIFTVLVK